LAYQVQTESLTLDNFLGQHVLQQRWVRLIRRLGTAEAEPQDGNGEVIVQVQTDLLAFDFLPPDRDGVLEPFSRSL
jgi:hypothetical protein